MEYISENKILNDTSRRLGLKHEGTIKKAEEFCRSLQSKTNVKLNDIAKTVLCLDLAANLLGVGFDKEIALKLSNLKKTPYQNSLHNLEKLLGLDKPLSVSELCVLMSCTSVKDNAENLFKSYCQNDAIKDFAHPQYVAAAVYTTCKLKKVSVEKSPFVSVSRLKSSQWNELVDEFTKFANSIGLRKESRKTKKDLSQDEPMQVDESEPVIKKKDSEEIEEYEVWKERILKEAREALGQV